MSAQLWNDRFSAWFDWYNSGGGCYFNGGGGDPQWDYYVKNYNYANQTAYNKDGSKMCTLSEGQSYGMLYALLGDNVKAFNGCLRVLLQRHLLTADNIAASKNALVYGTPAWPDGYQDFMANDGTFVLDDKGAHASLNLFGWVWSEDYANDASVKQGISSIYLAPDGEIVMAACLLLAYERWNVPGWRDTALQIIADASKYAVRQAGGRYVFTMGQYRGAGGFLLPEPRNVGLNAGTVYPGSNDILFSTADFTTGDQVRFWLNDGSTMPAPLQSQDALGEVWPVYYIRVNDGFNASFHLTRNDAIANTNEIDITTTGSGSMIVYPYRQGAGQVGSNPSYLFAPFFRLFAKYDTARAALWNNLSDNTYVDILHGYTLNYWKMSPYLDGVNIADGSNAFFRAGGDSAASSPDAFRVSLNLAFDGSTAALDALKFHCDLVSGKWVPKAGAAGGIWRFYVDTGFLPFTMGATPIGGTIVDANINVAANTIDLANDYLADAGTYSTPIRFVGASLPGGLSSTICVYARKTGFNTYTFHTSRAGALANTGVIDITTLGSGSRSWVKGWNIASVDLATDRFNLAEEDGAFRTTEPIRMVQGGGTLAGGLNASTVYYGRLIGKASFTLHTTEAGARNNTGRVDLTSTGTGEICMTKDSAPVGWYYRGGIGATTEMSPYGAAQVLSYIYALNGYEDAEVFYNSLPDWIKQQGNGSFVESNGDYYVQHSMGWIAGIMSGRANARLNTRNYLIFAANNMAGAVALQNQLAAALGVSVYAGLLKESTDGRYAVPVVGNNAWKALDSTQQSNTVKVLPTGNWRVNQ